MIRPHRLPRSFSSGVSKTGQDICPHHIPLSGIRGHDYIYLACPNKIENIRLIERGDHGMDALGEPLCRRRLLDAYLLDIHGVNLDYYFPG